MYYGIQAIIIQFQYFLISQFSFSLSVLLFFLFTSLSLTCLFISHNSVLDTEISDKFYLFLQKGPSLSPIPIPKAHLTIPTNHPHTACIEHFLSSLLSKFGNKGAYQH